MALTQIRKANKKYKREHRRKQIQKQRAEERKLERVRNRRTAKMMVQGRKEHLAKRRSELSYVNDLQEEIENG